MTEKKRIVWIDVAKAIGILLMIVGHTFLNDSLSRKLIFSFHMPLFFILAGYTFRVKPTRDVISSSAKRLLLPYALIYIVLQILNFVQSPEIGLSDLGRFALSFIFASGTELYAWGIPTVGVVWFLVALFVARVMFNVFTGFFEKRKLARPLQLLFWILWALVGILINRKLPLSADIAMVACLFMYLGWRARALDLEAVMRRWWTFPCAVVLWALCVHFSYLELAARSYDLLPFSIIGAFAGSYITFQIAYFISQRSKILIRPLTWIGLNSLLVLCIHALDWILAPWTSLPLLAVVPLPYFTAGCVRACVDLAIAYVVRKV